MIVAIHQPNYLPWIGYFHKMLSSDVFVILDDVLCSGKYERRNVIKGAEGTIPLTLPLVTKHAQIKDIEINNQINWKQKHFGSLQACYARTPYWNKLSPLISEIYQQASSKLAELNLRLIEFIRDYLNIKTTIIRSSELSGISGKKDDRNISICKATGADVLLSGTGAKAYMQPETYQKNNISIVFQEFEHPVYPQQWGSFIPYLSIVDLLFNCGPTAKLYISKQVII